MTNPFANFKSASRVALVALVLGAGGMAAAPAQAQNFSFGFQIPGAGQSNGGGNFQFDFGSQGTQRHGGGYQQRCLTNREIQRGIADYGFRNVQVTRELRRDRVEVRANYRRDVYTMRVDRCTGRVDRVEIVDRRGNDHRPDRDRDNSDRGWPFNQY